MNDLTPEGVREEFDLQPDPRVLQMLGEIDLDPWRCLAELIDNGIDGFLHAIRGGGVLENPEIRVTLPNRDDESAKVQIFDNGPGMDANSLERAVRAGYSGNNPTDNLGLFGMGFNIATARLGATTTVWSTRAGDPVVHGVRIDFADLRARRSFRTPHLTQSKSDPSQHFTRIEISNLKPDQRQFLVKASNQRSIRNNLANSYASMLRQGGAPITFSLRVNDLALQGRRHCVWGEARAVEVPGVGRVEAFKQFDHRLMADSITCSHCLNSMLATDFDEEVTCLNCGRSDGLVRKERRLRGWIGLQRYQHTSDYGIDFIRNGRKIEIASKDLFYWVDDEGSSLEYPVDDQRSRGRIVGEIHLDHCPVDFSKQRFDRSHKAWGEMLRFIRGEGPLLPQKAEKLGFGRNDSILFNHFKAFRRSSPTNAVAGGWQRIVAVPDNDMATQMAELFHEGRVEYQDDTKWWNLAVEEDQRRLTATTRTSPSGNNGNTAAAAVADAVADIFGEVPRTAPVTPSPPVVPAAPPRSPVASLSRVYEFRNTKVEVKSFAVMAKDPDLLGAPFRFMRHDPKSKDFHFLFDPEARVFRSITFGPSEALLTELAWHLCEIYRGAAGATPAATILDDLRNKYATAEALNVLTVAQAASQSLKDLTSALLWAMPEADRRGLFDELTERERMHISSQLFRRGGTQQAFQDGTFLRFFPEALGSLVDQRPELFFDGAVWNAEHGTIDLKDPEATVDARRLVRERAKSWVADAIWATTLDKVALVPSRDELLRAISAVRLLAPDRDFE
jgi:hypothetical protein